MFFFLKKRFWIPERLIANLSLEGGLTIFSFYFFVYKKKKKTEIMKFIFLYGEAVDDVVYGLILCKDDFFVHSNNSNRII